MPAKYERKNFPRQVEICKAILAHGYATAIGISSTHNSSGYNVFKGLTRCEAIRGGERPRLTTDSMDIQIGYRLNNIPGYGALELYLGSEENKLLPIPGVRGHEDTLLQVAKRTGARKGSKTNYGSYEYVDVLFSDMFQDVTAAAKHCISFLNDCGVTAQDIPRFPKLDKLASYQRWFSHIGVSSQEILSGKYWDAGDLDKLSPAYLVGLATDALDGKVNRQVKETSNPNAPNHYQRHAIIELCGPVAAMTTRKEAPPDAAAYINSFMEAVRQFPVACSLIAGGYEVCSKEVQYFLENTSSDGVFNPSSWFNAMTSSRHRCGWKSRMAILCSEEERRVSGTAEDDESDIEVEAEAACQEDQEQDGEDSAWNPPQERTTPSLTHIQQLETMISMVKAAAVHSKSTGIPLRNSKALVTAFHAKLMECDATAASDLSLLPQVQEYRFYGQPATFRQHLLAEVGTRAMAIQGHELAEKIAKTLNSRVKAEA